MARDVITRRARGQGSILRKGRRYYLRVRSNNAEKHILLTDTSGIPVSNRISAEASAKLLSNIAGSTSLIELESFVKVAKLNMVSQIPLAAAWDTFISLYIADTTDSTLKQYKSKLDCFIRWIRYTFPSVQFIHEVTAGMVENYVVCLQRRTGLRSSTINGKITTLKNIFKVLLPDQVNPFARIRRLKSQRSLRTAITREQLRALLQALDEMAVTGHRKGVRTGRKISGMADYRIVILICIYTGLRISDVYTLRWENVDFKRNTIWTVPKKTERSDPDREGVTIPIYCDLKKELEIQRKKQPRSCDWVIGPNLSKQTLRNLKSICNRILDETLNPDNRGKKGRKKYTVHCLRHTFISDCINKGVPADVVAILAGQKSLSSTKVYTHIYDESKIEAINSLDSIYRKEDNTDTGVEAKRDDLMSKLKTLPDGVVDLLLQAVAK